MSFSLLVYIYIFLLSALTPPLHVPCIRFAIICLTANIQPNFANGIHLVAKTKTTGKTEKTENTEKTIFFHRIYLPSKYGFFQFFRFFHFFHFFSSENKKKLKKTKKLSVLQSSTPELLCTTKFYSVLQKPPVVLCTAKCYSVPQSTALQ